MVERRKPKPKLKVVEGLTDAPELTAEIAKISEALAAFSTDVAKLGSGLWTEIGAAVFTATGGSAEGLALFDEWSRPWIYYEPDAAQKRWASCRASPPKMDASTLDRMAERVRAQQRALEEASRLDDVAYQQQRGALKEQTGLPTSTLDKERKKRRSRGSAPPPPPPPPPIEELAKACPDLIDAEDVLELFVKDVSKRLAGADDGIAELLYLAVTSRLFDKPMNVVIKGESAAGKSYERDCVLAYLPEGEVCDLTTMSEKALYYLPGNLSHKVLSMAEAVGDKESELRDYLIREMISNGSITHWVAVKGAPGELPRTQPVTIEGPIMFVTTTTRARLHPEIETRLLTIEINDTERQTRRVIEKVVEIEGGLADADKPDAKWHAYQRWLAAGERRVVIPFALTLGRHPDVYTRHVRMRRDIRQVLNVVRAHALLHRAHRERDDRGRIVADIQRDYTTAYDLLADRLAQGAGVKLPKKMTRVLDELHDRQIGLAKDEGVLAADLETRLRLSQPTVRRRLAHLIAAGFVENIAPGKGRTGRYRVVAEPGERAVVLPDPNDLHKAFLSPKGPENAD